MKCDHRWKSTWQGWVCSKCGKPKVPFYSERRKKILTLVNIYTNKSETIKAIPKLIAYGSSNVYEINGKAYYQDIVNTNKFVRAPERDNLIQQKQK